jgi:hypothetical protein
MLSYGAHPAILPQPRRLGFAAEAIEVPGSMMRLRIGDSVRRMAPSVSPTGFGG